VDECGDGKADDRETDDGKCRESDQVAAAAVCERAQ
jgi:hypothetical protein